MGDYGCCVVSAEDHHETGGRHLHAFLKFSRTRRVGSKIVARMFDWAINGRTYHPNIELVKNSKRDVSRVVQYVTKDGDFLADNCDVKAIIEMKHARKYNTKRILETDIMELVEKEEIRAQDFMTILKAQQTYRLMTPAPNSETVRGIWLHGKSGSGKSTWARAFGLDHGGFFLKQQNKWWDGYRGEPVVIIDDLDTGALNHYLKIWADKWAATGEVKGATINLYYRYLVVTSNYSIEEIVGRGLRDGEAFDQDLCESLARRFTLMELPENQAFFTYDGERYLTDLKGEIVDLQAPGSEDERRIPRLEESERLQTEMEDGNSQMDSVWEAAVADEDTGLE